MIQSPQQHLSATKILKYGVVLLVLLLGTNSTSFAQARQETYSVVGIARGETLSVRSGPGANNPVIAKLRGGATGIQVVGRVVRNANDDWAPIRFSSGKGWVRSKFLSLGRRQTLLANSPTSEAYGRAPYPTGQSGDFFGVSGPRIKLVPGHSLAYSYASQGYFNRAQVCVTHGDGTIQDIAAGKGAYAKSNQLELTPFGKRLTKGVKYVPRKIVTCPLCDGTGLDRYSGSCWKCGGRGTVKAPQGWNAILGLD
jgi:uncharacterized protein YraI